LFLIGSLATLRIGRHTGTRDGSINGNTHEQYSTWLWCIWSARIPLFVELPFFLCSFLAMFAREMVAFSLYIFALYTCPVWVFSLVVGDARSSGEICRTVRSGIQIMLDTEMLLCTRANCKL